MPPKEGYNIKDVNKQDGFGGPLNEYFFILLIYGLLKYSHIICKWDCFPFGSDEKAPLKIHAFKLKKMSGKEKMVWIKLCASVVTGNAQSLEGWYINDQILGNSGIGDGALWIKREPWRAVGGRRPAGGVGWNEDHQNGIHTCQQRVCKETDVCKHGPLLWSSIDFRERRAAWCDERNIPSTVRDPAPQRMCLHQPWQCRAPGFFQLAVSPT